MRKRNAMPDSINRAFAMLSEEVKRDTFNLSRDDQDAIEVKTAELRAFIQEQYDKRRPAASS